MPIRVDNRNGLSVYRPQASLSFNADASSVDLASAAAERASAQSQNAAQAFAKLGQSIQAALKRREELRDAADYADAVNQMDAAALRFQNEFTDNRKGRDARGAGDLFMGFTKERAADLAKQYEDRPELARRIRTYGDALAVKSFGVGQHYEDGQETEYRKSVLGTGLARFKSVLGTGSEAEIAVEKVKYLALLKELDPGMDHGKEALALDAAEAGAFFDRRLAAEDYAGAAQVLKMRGTAFGEHLPAAQLKLRQARKAAEAEARQRRNEAAAQSMNVFNAAVFNAKLTGDPAEVKASLRDMRKSGLFTEAQMQSMERQVMGLEADQLGLMIKEAAADPSVDLAPLVKALDDAALPFKFKENAKLQLGRVERSRAGTELFAMVRGIDESDAKDTAPAWQRLEELKGKLTERDVLNFQKSLQGIDAKRIKGKVEDAEKTLSIDELREELKRGEKVLPEALRTALEGKMHEVSMAADDASTDLYAPMTQLRQTLAVVDANLQRRNEDGTSYYKAETLRALQLRRKHAAEQLKVLEKSYKDDPAGTALARLQAGTSPIGSISASITQEELDAKLIEDQRSNGVSSERISILPDATREGAARMWHGANFSTRVRMAQELKARHGTYAEMALREISRGRQENYADGSPKPFDATVAETVMAVADGRADPAQAEEFLAAYALRGKDVMTPEGKTSQDANAVAEDALAETLASSNRYQHVIEMARRTMNPQLNTMAKNLADTTKILLLQGRDAETAAKVLDHGLKAVQAESVTRTRGEMPVSDEMLEGAGESDFPVFSIFSKTKIPFKVTVELPPQVGEEEVLSRIADHGYDAFQSHLADLIDAGVAADIAQGYEPALAYAKAKAKGMNPGMGMLNSSAESEEESAAAAKTVFTEDEEAVAAHKAETVVQYEHELALRRIRLEEQLLKSGWWGNDPNGDPNLLCFFDSTGAAVFSIPLRGN